MRQRAPAAERNTAPILEVLHEVLPPAGALLEIASGTGQHAAAFAEAFPDWTFQPTEHDGSKLDSIRAWTEDASNVHAPVQLDVTRVPWSISSVDAVFCANMIHIAPAEVVEGLLHGASGVLRAGGCLLVYGPFRIDGAHTAPSNEVFDASLRARDPRWGVRDLEDLTRVGRSCGLSLERVFDMPANNKTCLFRHGGHV